VVGLEACAFYKDIQSVIWGGSHWSGESVAEKRERSLAAIKKSISKHSTCNSAMMRLLD